MLIADSGLQVRFVENKLSSLKKCEKIHEEMPRQGVRQRKCLDELEAVTGWRKNA